jgi:GNAT superfamily N-acetyltransferase
METLQTSQHTAHASQSVSGLPAVVVQPVSTKKLLAQFIDFPHELYRNDSNYVPELFIAQRDLLTPGKHPFHEHSELQTFLAFRDGKVVGRIAAINNRNHNSFNDAQDGFFGFFDCINDKEVSEALFQTAADWLKKRNLKTIIGPVNFSTNEACGLLIEGFDGPPVVMMPYNSPYYVPLIEDAGLSEKVTLLAYTMVPKMVEDKPIRMTELLKERLARRNIVIRNVNLKGFDQEVVKIREIYNKAWDKNLGFVPMTDKEFAYLAKDLKMILDPDFCLVAEENGVAIGFALAIPDLNQVLAKIKKGRLLPTGIFKLLLNKKKINGLRVLALGVLASHRKLGIETCFYGELIKKGREKGFVYAEASWILEHNDMMNMALINIKADPYRRYRIYEKAL